MDVALFDGIRSAPDPPVPSFRKFYRGEEPPRVVLTLVGRDGPWLSRDFIYEEHLSNVKRALDESGVQYHLNAEENHEAFLLYGVKFESFPKWKLLRRLDSLVFPELQCNFWNFVDAEDCEPLRTCHSILAETVCTLYHFGELLGRERLFKLVPLGHGYKALIVVMLNNENPLSAAHNAHPYTAMKSQLEEKHNLLKGMTYKMFPIQRVAYFYVEDGADVKQAQRTLQKLGTIAQTLRRDTLDHRDVQISKSRSAKEHYDQLARYSDALVHDVERLEMLQHRCVNLRIDDNVGALSEQVVRAGTLSRQNAAGIARAKCPQQLYKNLVAFELVCSQRKAEERKKQEQRIAARAHRRATEAGFMAGKAHFSGLAFDEDLLVVLFSGLSGEPERDKAFEDLLAGMLVDVGNADNGNDDGGVASENEASESGDDCLVGLMQLASDASRAYGVIVPSVRSFAVLLSCPNGEISESEGVRVHWDRSIQCSQCCLRGHKETLCPLSTTAACKKMRELAMSNYTGKWCLVTNPEECPRCASLSLCSSQEKQKNAHTPIGTQKPPRRNWEARQNSCNPSGAEGSSPERAALVSSANKSAPPPASFTQETKRTKKSKQANTKKKASKGNGDPARENEASSTAHPHLPREPGLPSSHTQQQRSSTTSDLASQSEAHVQQLNKLKAALNAATCRNSQLTAENARLKHLATSAKERSDQVTAELKEKAAAEEELMQEKNKAFDMFRKQRHKLKEHKKKLRLAEEDNKVLLSASIELKHAKDKQQALVAQLENVQRAYEKKLKALKEAEQLRTSLEEALGVLKPEKYSMYATERLERVHKKLSECAEAAQHELWQRQHKKELDLCAICSEHAKQVAIIPCGHYMLCGHCADKVETCPICRGPIDKRVRIYNSG